MPNQVEQMIVNDLFNPNGGPNEEKFSEDCGPDVLQEITQNAIHMKGGKDTLIWTLSTNGVFTFESAWNLVRQKPLNV